MPLAIVILVATSFWPATGSAQGVAARSPSSRLDPAFAAMLLVAADHAEARVPAAAAAPKDASVTTPERLTLRRGRWLLGTGIAIAVTSTVAGLTIGRADRCEAHDDEVIDKTAPRVTSAVVGTIGLVLAGFGAARFASVPKSRRELARASGGQRLAIIFASLGLSVATLGLVGVSALPAAVNCWTT